MLNNSTPQHCGKRPRAWFLSLPASEADEGCHPTKLPMPPAPSNFRESLERARKKSFGWGFKPLRRLFPRNQSAVNSRLIEAMHQLSARNERMLTAALNLEARLAGMTSQAKDLHQSSSETPLSTPPDLDYWRSEIEKIDWFHEFDFGNGLRAYSRIGNPHIAGLRRNWAFTEEQLNKVEFKDKSVLDVGAWDGLWSFLAEARGAGSVLATDDISQNWGKQTGLPLARKLLNSNIEVRQDVAIYDLASLNRKFDILLCLGVFYHLHDPFYGFTQLRHCCHADTIVAIEGEVAWSGVAPNEARYFCSHDLEFLPSEDLLTGLLKLAYFRVESFTWMHPFPRTPSQAGELQRDRVFLICRPFTGSNEMYLYRPHFGLHIYDDRFNGQVQ